jgi:very-short-patch-repair endonuclease
VRLGRGDLKDAASLARTRGLDGSSIHVCYRLTGMGWGEGSGVSARYLKRDASVNSEILGRLVIEKNGVELRSLAKKLGWNNLVSLSRELQALQGEGCARFSGGRWQATAKGRRCVSSEAAPQSQIVRAPRIRSAVQSKAESRTEEGEGTLTTIPVQARRQHEPAPNRPSPTQEGTLSVPALLSYYRSCLAAEDRNDPKADWDEAGERFVPIRLSGAWWPTDGRPSMMSVARTLLPEAFQQALGRSTAGGTLHLGYPLDVYRAGSSGLMVRAVCSVPLRWKVAANDVVVFETIETDVTLNAGWMNFHRKQVNLRALAERIAPGFLSVEAEDDGYDAPLIQPVELQELCAALNLAFAKKRNGELTPVATEPSMRAKPGLHNVAALFVTGGARYSAAAIRDLEVLAKYPERQFRGPALATVLDLGQPERLPDAAVYEPIDLTYSQLAAVRSALSEALTVITGPPGTGKSQVVTAILASATTRGRTVLFASRNHAALDAVEPRLEELSPDRPLMIRLNRRWGDGSPVRISDLIRTLVARPVSASDGLRPDDRVLNLSTLNEERAVIMDRALALALDREAVAAMEAELSQCLTALRLDSEQVAKLTAPRHAAGCAQGRTGWIGHPFRIFVAKKYHQAAWEEYGCPAPNRSSFDQHSQWVARLGRAKQLMRDIRERASCLPSERDQTHLGKRLETLTVEIRSVMRRLMPALAKSLDWMDDDERKYLLEMRGNAGKGRLSGAEVAAVLRHYPIWALSNLTVARFVPPELIFDYVVIDEASQCDIASALPLLARARRAVVVGDPAQLGVVSTLSPDWEVELLDSLGLSSAPGIGRFRQSRNSLFDLASTVNGASRHLLTDHFRCHADIAAYVEGFYGSQLSVLTEPTQMNPPPGHRPSLFWEDVSGPIEEARKGCHSSSEAAAIVDALGRLLVDQRYQGTVGVCTPFREQANRISDKIAERFPPELVNQRRLIAQTANGFQGDSRDVIFISPCLGPGMPTGSLGFVRDGGNLFNVAVSRARAVCRIFGNIEFARRCSISHISRLVAMCDRHNQCPEEGPMFDSPWEEMLFQALDAAGIKCVSQFPLAGRRLDLAFFKHGGRRIDIEVDGDRYHRDASGLRKIDDLWRDHQLRGLGWEVIRFWVYELRENIDGCVERVRRAVMG